LQKSIFGIGNWRIQYTNVVSNYGIVDAKRKVGANLNQSKQTRVFSELSEQVFSEMKSLLRKDLIPRLRRIPASSRICISLSHLHVGRT